LQHADQISGFQKFLSCLLAPTAFGLGCSYIAFWETQGPGLQSATIRLGAGECDNFTFSYVLACLALDSVLYVLLACYVDAVFPGEFGVPQSPLFFLRKSFVFFVASVGMLVLKLSRKYSSFWFGTRDVKVGALQDGIASATGIHVKNLSKQYDAEFCAALKKPALDNVNLSLAQGDITVCAIKKIYIKK
jgi:ATP-binding cassette subfamily A (ABC1) protein 3